MSSLSKVSDLEGNETFLLSEHERSLNEVMRDNALSESYDQMRDSNPYGTDVDIERRVSDLKSDLTDIDVACDGSAGDEQIAFLQDSFAKLAPHLMPLKDEIFCVVHDSIPDMGKLLDYYDYGEIAMEVATALYKYLVATQQLVIDSAGLGEEPTL